MNIWILTVGSSDVQLKTKANWTNLFRTVRSQLDDRAFNPIDGIESRFQVHARAMGTVYSQPQAEQYFDDLDFPLIDNFIHQLNNKSIEKIILVLSDQSVFSKAERSSQRHPYWQDTCTLQPILEKYLQAQLNGSSPKLHIQPLFLKPKLSTEGLDDWDSVLKLVQSEFLSLNLEFLNDATIYVSHQAGTPAISSAIQFSSLSQFRQKVKFLVSNERDASLTRVLDGSEYLKGIRKQEAKKLLERHDYSGVQELIFDYLDKETLILLKAAIQWNFSKFDEFANELQNLSNQELAQEAKERSQQWWWTAYEAAYLGAVRLKQENAVEAMFHSFRAVEGLLRQWVDKFYADEIKQTKHPKWEENERWDRKLNIYGQDLYWFLTLKKTVDQTNDITRNTTPDIFIFGTQVFNKRNDLFHQLKGLQGKEEVFKNWRSQNEKQWKPDPESEWKKRVLTCLNFIAKESLPNDKEFKLLEEASLMVKVHQELEKAIAQL